MEGVVDHQVGRGGNQGQRAAEECGEGQRHQQVARVTAKPLADAQDHRNEDRHDPGGTHEGAQPGHHQHQQDQEPGLTGPGDARQPDADPHGHPGLHQTLADHEQCRDQDHHGIAEAGHRRGDGEDATQDQGDDHHQGHHIGPQPTAGKQPDGGSQ